MKPYPIFAATVSAWFAFEAASGATAAPLIALPFVLFIGAAYL